MEVEIRPPLNWGLPNNYSSSNNLNINCEEGVPHFLCDVIDVSYLQGDFQYDCPMYKRMHLDIDVLGKSDRVEWGHAKYQTIFRPDQAYELVLEWLVASGSIVSELVNV